MKCFSKRLISLKTFLIIICYFLFTFFYYTNTLFADLKKIQKNKIKKDLIASFELLSKNQLSRDKDKINKLLENIFMITSDEFQDRKIRFSQDLYLWKKYQFIKQEFKAQSNSKYQDIIKEYYNLVKNINSKAFCAATLSGLLLSEDFTFISNILKKDHYKNRRIVIEIFLLHNQVSKIIDILKDCIILPKKQVKTLGYDPYIKTDIDISTHNVIHQKIKNFKLPNSIMEAYTNKIIKCSNSDEIAQCDYSIPEMLSFIQKYEHLDRLTKSLKFIAKSNCSSKTKKNAIFYLGLIGSRSSYIRKDIINFIKDLKKNKCTDKEIFLLAMSGDLLSLYYFAGIIEDLNNVNEEKSYMNFILSSVNCQESFVNRIISLNFYLEQERLPYRERKRKLTTLVNFIGKIIDYDRSSYILGFIKELANFRVANDEYSYHISVNDLLYQMLKTKQL